MEKNITWAPETLPYTPITPEEARANVKPGSLAEAFLLGSFEDVYHFPVRSSV